MKELFELYSFIKKTRWTFALFKSIFLRNRSLSYSIGDLYLTKILFGRNKICCVEDNHSYMSNMRAKEF